ncbi:MAG: N5-glutamine methyltransferase family protein, partial [Hyphomicrobiaceae bacterium]
MRPPEAGRETIRQAMVRVTACLRAAGIETPERDARLLLSAACGANPTELIAEPRRLFEQEAAERMTRYLRRRMAREPVSRILGSRAFYGRDFALSPATFDPRPDSETLIDAVLELAREEGWIDLPIQVLDIGTGTGCLLITVLAELPRAAGVGVDIDADALRVAECNGIAHGMTDRVRWVQSDLATD